MLCWLHTTATFENPAWLKSGDVLLMAHIRDPMERRMSARWKVVANEELSCL